MKKETIKTIIKVILLLILIIGIPVFIILCMKACEGFFAGFTPGE